MGRTAKHNPLSAFLEKSMISAMRASAVMSYPTSFEKLEIDQNRAVWLDDAPPDPPCPPLQQNITADLAIIGGGFTGTSTAYHFSRQYPEKKVVLLEAKSLANGASGRNGGMLLNWINGVEDTSPEMTKLIYETTSGGMDLIEEIIQRHHLKVSYRRDGSMVAYTNAQRAEAAHEEAEYLTSLGIPTQYLDSAMLKKTLQLESACGALLDPVAGQINGAQLVRGLRPVLLEQGVEIYENTPVLKVREGSTITLTTPQGEVQAKAIVLATNGYTGKLGYFRKALFPLHSHVFATAPLTPDQLQQIGWHSTSGYSDDMDRISYSSLTRDGRIIFGGGSNESYSYLFNNRTAYPHAASEAQGAMESTMYGYLPKLRELGIPITHRWTGTLAISFKRNCSMGVMGADRNIYYALGYSGHGVTLANLAGRILTDIYSGDDQRWRNLPFYQAKFAPIPLEPFRWMGYQMFTRLTGRSPRA